MLRIGIVDDEPLSLASIRELLESLPGYQTGLATTDPTRLLYAAEQREIDIVITDINMPGMDGVILSEMLRKLDVPVIICSAYPDRALECIHTQVVDFVVKPPNKLRIFRGLSIARERLELKAACPAHEKPYILVSKCGNKTLQKLVIDEIIFVEQKTNYAIIHLQEDEIKYRTPFSRLYLQPELHQFVKIHRSYAFNMKYFSKIENDRITLSNGVVLPIGRSFSKIIPVKINRYLSDRYS